MFQWTVFCLVYLIQWSKCGTLLDAELIPEEIRTPGFEFLGKSLSLGIGTNARQRRNFQLPLPELISDQDGSASGLQGYLGVEGNRYGGSQFYGAEDQGASQGEVGFYGRAAKKGSSGHSADDEYRDVQRASHDDRSDAGRYNGQTSANKEHDIAKSYEGAQGVSRHGQGVQRVGNKGGHRKGHHKSGFTNSYHKDESGNKSDFYDDDVDEGDHFLVDTRDGAFYDVAAADERAKFRDAALRNEARGSAGAYNRGHNFADQQGRKGNYGQGRYYDDKLDYGNRKVGQRYDQSIHEGGEQQGTNRLDNSGLVYNQRQAYLPQPVALVPVRSYYPVNHPVGGLEYYPAPVEPGSYYPSKPSAVNYAGRGVALLEDPRATPQYYNPPRDVYYTSSGY